ncbi:polysaccharide deacetylase family protein [Tahibacter amnicola]|uniref:Polysaccharide deacetylase family protein n=1 Tax=Tahibacter amnicola TaxID=2976241 RepID=A0ABY6BEL3_9GAMM|nr:polysaccharide deacetylase family protein [Tahibacter amnicola]UXI68026.1 polysaccharide deacetylase family protein [Tahibacter amnicola]
MRRQWRLLLGWILAGATACAQAGEMAITVDDLPWVEFEKSSPAEVQDRHRRLVKALTGTHATGFVNEDKLYVGEKRMPTRVAMLEDWLRARLELGNHTFGHVGLHDVPVETYEAAILRGETVLRPLMARHGMTLRWFRHPYLHAGRDDAARAHLDAFLARHGYRIAPVTIDNGDWVYARAYVDALNRADQEGAARIRTDFVDYIVAKVKFFERNTLAMFGREIPQILLLHGNALNADTLPSLLPRLRDAGYRFVTLDKALADPAYQETDGYRGRGGISWLHRWALTQKRPKTFYEGEPSVPQFVLDRAGVKSE